MAWKYLVELGSITVMRLESDHKVEVGVALRSKIERGAGFVALIKRRERAVLALLVARARHDAGSRVSSYTVAKFQTDFRVRLEDEGDVVWLVRNVEC